MLLGLNLRTKGFYSLTAEEMVFKECWLFFIQERLLLSHCILSTS